MRRHDEGRRRLCALQSWPDTLEKLVLEVQLLLAFGVGCRGRENAGWRRRVGRLSEARLRRVGARARAGGGGEDGEVGARGLRRSVGEGGEALRDAAVGGHRGKAGARSGGSCCSCRVRMIRSRHATLGATALSPDELFPLALLLRESAVG